MTKIIYKDYLNRFASITYKNDTAYRIKMLYFKGDYKTTYRTEYVPRLQVIDYERFIVKHKGWEKVC